MKSELVIIDEIGYTPIEKQEANLFLNMISELYEKVWIIVTSNKSFETWAEMMGDSVMTTALLARLLHHARVFTLDGESYRIKESREEAESFP
jgi:DNA replication protein DnaC